MKNRCMKTGTVIIAALLLAAPAHATTCDLEQAGAIEALPAPEKADEEFDVAEQQSVEGGLWSIHLGADKKPRRILRTDYGETGRAIHELITTAGDDYILRVTMIRYSAPIQEDGSDVIREETDRFVFCDGELQVPPNWTPQASYLAAAKSAAAAFFSAPEIAGEVKAAGLTPPLWK
jgi:hypothetical protein